MHFYAVSCGIKNEVDLFIQQLSSQYLPFKYIDKEGKEQDNVLQFSVRPVQLWEFAFPETHRDAVINTILKGYDGKQQFSVNQIAMNTLRKALGIKPFGTYDKTKMLPVGAINNHIRWYPIGEKEDNYLDKDGNIKPKGTPNTYEGI